MTIRNWTRTDHRRFPVTRPPVENPDSTWAKGDIVRWLAGRGVGLDKKALQQLTKHELLELVDDILSPSPEEG
jgi:hypothetical protein